MTFIFLIGVACGSMSSAVCALVALHCVRHVNKPRQTLGVRPVTKGDRIEFEKRVHDARLIRAE